LEEHSDWILALIAKQPDLTLEEILAVMAKQGIPGSRSALQRFFDRHNVSFKKTISDSVRLWA
jgi:transposase